MNKIALITGASGQDSLTLARYLIASHNYKVFATTRRSARPQSLHVTKLLSDYPDNYQLINADITDISSIIEAIKITNPDEFYNLAAQSHVGLSFKEPISTAQITGLGVMNCLEAIRKTNPKIRFYQASSSEMFGGTKGVIRNEFKDHNTNINQGEVFLSSKNLDRYTISKIDENTPFTPRSPYACAKVFGHTITTNYREAYGIHASCGILFNHEGIYRKPEFVTRKITVAASKIALKMQNKLKLGTLDFARDWGCANDYVIAMHKMLQQESPDDYIIATGEIHTGLELLQIAFEYYGLYWVDYVELDKEFTRPSDVRVLVGDASKAQEKLQWKHNTSFKDMILTMLNNDYQILSKYGEVQE